MCNVLRTVLKVVYISTPSLQKRPKLEPHLLFVLKLVSETCAKSCQAIFKFSISFLQTTVLCCITLNMMDLGVARPPPRDWSREWKVLGKCLGMTGKHRARSIMVHVRTTNGVMIVVPTMKASNRSSSTHPLRTRPRVPQTGTCSFSWEVNYNPQREPKSLLVAKCTGAHCNRCDAIYYTHNVLVSKANCPGVWEWKQETHKIAYVQRRT